MASPLCEKFANLFAPSPPAKTPARRPVEKSQDLERRWNVVRFNDENALAVKVSKFKLAPKALKERKALQGASQMKVCTAEARPGIHHHHGGKASQKASESTLTNETVARKPSSPAGQSDGEAMDLDS